MKTIESNFVFLGIFVLTFIVNSCCKGVTDKYFYIKDEYKLIYQQGDTLLYEGDKGNEIKLYVSEIKQNLNVGSHIDCNKYEFHEDLTFIFNDYHNNTEQYSILQTSSRQYIIEWFDDLEFATSYSDIPKFDTLEINNYKFYAIYQLFEISNAGKIINDSVYAYYNYNYGIIKFKNFEGEMFQLNISQSNIQILN